MMTFEKHYKMSSKDKKVSSTKVALTLMQLALVDVRLSASDFKLYCSLVHIWMDRKSPRVIEVRRRDVMQASLIRSKTTFHKAIETLLQANYINYSPTFHPARYSEIEIVLQPTTRFNNSSFFS